MIICYYEYYSDSFLSFQVGLAMFFDGDQHENAAHQFVAELRDRQVHLASGPGPRYARM